MAFQKAAMILSFLQFLGYASSLSSSRPQCKTTPDSKEWPSDNEWAGLNRSISGQLIKTVPPGAVCHPDQAAFDVLACPSVIAGWKTSVWHTNNPVSSVQDNWNNDTCLPNPITSCSGAGYPIYVVNATCAEDVKWGIEFAGKNNIRLVVKGTGHDYLGRYFTQS